MAYFDMDQRLVARMTLSAPANAQETLTLNRVILAISVLSIVGAGWIMLSFCLFKQVRTFRHQLILGLAISDFCMAINFLASCAVNLAGHPLGDLSQKKLCSFNGFMTQLFVVQTDYWVLVIAVCTFLILANHKHMSTWIQAHGVVLWIVPWGLSSLCAALGLALAGYGDIGAWCWFTSDKVRLLVNFVPRWIIIITILIFYVRLYRIIYKAHARFMSFHDESSPNVLEPHSVSSEPGSVASTRRIDRPSITMQMASKDMDTGVEQYGATGSGRTHVRQPSPVLKKLARQMMMYPLVYILIWTIPTSIRIYQSVTGKAAPFEVATVDKACIVIQGFADAIIYGVNESSLNVWREKFSGSIPTELMTGNPTVNVELEIKIEGGLRSLSRVDSL